MIRVETARSTPRPQAIPRADFPYLGAPMERILVVEDDRAVQKALKRLFESEGFAVEISADGKSALDAFRATGPAAIVLDLRLPSMSGRDVCREIKQQSPAVPVIVLSAASDVSDKVLLLELGADDYVTKPFSPRELLARVRAALRRTTRTGVGEVFAFDAISVDFTKMEVTRDGQPVGLTAQEFKTLKFMVENAVANQIPALNAANLRRAYLHQSSAGAAKRPQAGQKRNFRRPPEFCQHLPEFSARARAEPEPLGRASGRFAYSARAHDDSARRHYPGCIR